MFNWLFIPEEIVSGPEVVMRLPNPISGGTFVVTETVVTTWVIMAAFFIIFFFGVRNLNLVPGKVQSYFEALYDFYDWVTESVLKKWKKKLTAYVAALISFLMVANTISLVPLPKFQMIEGVLTVNSAFKVPTSDINTTIGLALVTTIMFLFFGIANHGLLGYFKGSLLEPSPLMLPMNIIGELSKPVNISMRLFGNMLGGMVIIGLLYKASTMLIGSSLIIVPLHLYFDIFAGLVQSYIFTTLTMVYINMAIGDAECD